MNTIGWIGVLYKEVYIMPRGCVSPLNKKLVCPDSCPSIIRDGH